MLQDIANYDTLWEQACIKYVQEGRGSVEDFCKKHNLSDEHVNAWRKHNAKV